jgi:hypothetical protein
MVLNKLVLPLYSYQKKIKDQPTGGNNVKFG